MPFQPVVRDVLSSVIQNVLGRQRSGGGAFEIINDAGELAPYVTFTRSSTATYFDSNGVMQVAASNAPRYDYDPVTKVLRGLLIEEQRTNLLLQSGSMSTQSRTVTAVAHTLSFYGTGTVTLSGVSTAGPLVGTGANNRVTLTFTPTAGTLTLTVSGTVTNAQLEAGAFATSYIPTTTASVTRAADVAICTNLAAIGYATEGAFFAEASGESTGVRSLLNFRIGTSNTDEHRFYKLATAAIYISKVSTDQCVLAPAGSWATNQVRKFAAAYKTDDFAAALSGGTPVTDTAGSVPTAVQLDRFWVGSTAGVADHWNGHIRRLRYYARRLSNAELQALTS